MVSKGIKGLPVEQLEYRDNKLCAGELTVYNEFNTGTPSPAKKHEIRIDRTDRNQFVLSL